MPPRGSRWSRAKYDRCVRDVERKGGASNAYAVCSAQAKRSRRKGAYGNPHRLRPGDVVVVSDGRAEAVYVVGVGHRRRRASR